MKLYDSPIAPNPRRVRMYLAEKGIDIPKVTIDIGSGENLSPAYLAVNPHGVLPVLQLDDGTVIGETMAICRYLEALHPEPPLFGTSPLEIATIETWSRRAEIEGMFRVQGAFRNSHPRFKDRAMPGCPEPMAQIPEFAEQSRKMVLRYAGLLDQRLADHAHVAGEDFTMADINTLCAVDFAEKLARIPVQDDHPNIARWHAQVSARPSASA